MTIKNTFILPHPPIVVPEVGKGEENKIIKTIEGFEKVGKIIEKIKPDTIVIVSPHSSIYSDYINISTGKNGYGDLSNFNGNDVAINFSYDEKFIEELCNLAKQENIPAGNLGTQDDLIDHGVIVPFYYINKYYKDYKLVRIGVSGLPLTTHYKFGKTIEKISKKLDRNTVFIASGDLSHKLLEEGPYGFAKEGPKFDSIIKNTIVTGDFSELFNFPEEFLEEAAECGLRSFTTMAGVLDKKDIKSELFSYEGPFGIGYATGWFKVLGENKNREFDKLYKKNEEKRLHKIKEKEDEYVKLARNSLENYIKNDEYLKTPNDLPKELLENKAGVFVTIYKYGVLRGCIGTINPTKKFIAEEIIENAISSGTRDLRFPRVKEEELNQLEYSVDILEKAEEIHSLEELNPEKYGLIVTSGHKRGILLPNIPSVKTPEEQLKIVRQKAGIYAFENQKLERFKVVRHK